VVVAAATVILLRDGVHKPEVLMLRRNQRGQFGGMWVFPGGMVDPADADPAMPDDELGTARRAAVREAREEAGLDPDPSSLIPLSHWLPPASVGRRFSTWMLIAPAPAMSSVTVDGAEIHDHVWMPPGEVLASHGRGEMQLVPPTWMTLHWLAPWPSVGDALAAARRTEPEFYETHIAGGDDGGTRAALWAGDAGYEDLDLSRPGPRRRLWMAPGGWRLELGGLGDPA
jgi:8-oxo-dGTP pyrophosphatase MutT (NUDIX family)